MDKTTGIDPISSLKPSVEFRQLVSVSLWSGTIVSVISILVLIGWLLQVDFLKRIIPGYVFMNPTTAAAFILSSISLCLLTNANARRVRIAQICAALVLLIGLIKLVELIGFFDLGIDQILFRDQLFDNLLGKPNPDGSELRFEFFPVGRVSIAHQCSDETE